MIPERESPSSSNSPEPQGLLYILLSAFSFFSGWSLAKSRTNDGSKTVHPLDNAAPESRLRQLDPVPASQIPPLATQHYQSDRRKDNTAPWKKRAEIIAICIAGGLLLINILALLATTNAANTASRALRQSVESFRIDERGWIEIEPIKPTLIFGGAPPDVGAIFEYDIYPKNTGKTVVRDVSVKAESSGSSEELGTHANYISNYQDKYLLDKFTESNSGKIRHIPASPVPKVLAPNVVAPAPFSLIGMEPRVSKDGKRSLSYIIGRVDYIDAFKIPHWLKFCFFVSSASGELRSCAEGNDEDQNPEGP